MQDLLIELEQAFADVAQPTDAQIIYDNSGTHDECEQIKRAFSGRTWLSLSTPFMIEERSSYTCFTPEAFHYYFPAFVRLVLTDYDNADDLPSNLVYALTLPTELDIRQQAARLRYLSLDRRYPDTDFEAFMTNQLNHINQDIHNFFARFGRFSREQSTLVRRFLEYMQSQHADDFFHNEPTTALQRYWFQFTD